MENVLALQQLRAPVEAEPANSNFSVACEVKHSTVSYQCGKAF
jgi:hypothetical protein